MAQVKVNGKDLGILWKEPYRVEITGAAKTGENSLEVAVTNLWINRIIGDEQLPGDSGRNGDGALKKCRIGWSRASPVPPAALRVPHGGCGKKVRPCRIPG
jgi:hypothetical protein